MGNQVDQVSRKYANASSQICHHIVNINLLNIKHVRDNPLECIQRVHLKQRKTSYTRGLGISLLESLEFLLFFWLNPKGNVQERYASQRLESTPDDTAFDAVDAIKNVTSHCVFNIRVLHRVPESRRYAEECCSVPTMIGSFHREYAR